MEGIRTRHCCTRLQLASFIWRGWVLLRMFMPSLSFNRLAARGRPARQGYTLVRSRRSQEYHVEAESEPHRYPKSYWPDPSPPDRMAGGMIYLCQPLTGRVTKQLQQRQAMKAVTEESLLRCLRDQLLKMTGGLLKDSVVILSQTSNV